MANELFQVNVRTREIGNLYFTFMQVMMTEHAWYAPMKVAMTVYRCSPNKLATWRFVISRTKPASETRLRAGISNHGNAEKRRGPIQSQYLKRGSCADTKHKLWQTAVIISNYLNASMHEKKKRRNVHEHPVYFTSHQQQFISNTFLWIDIYMA